MPPPGGMKPGFHRKTDLKHVLTVLYSVTFGLASLALGDEAVHPGVHRGERRS